MTKTQNTESTECYACEWNLRSHQHIGCDRDPARTAPRSIVKRPADHADAGAANPTGSNGTKAAE